jgi:hypothetical protein
MLHTKDGFYFASLRMLLIVILNIMKKSVLVVMPVRSVVWKTELT